MVGRGRQRIPASIRFQRHSGAAFSPTARKHHQACDLQVNTAETVSKHSMTLIGLESDMQYNEQSQKKQLGENGVSEQFI